MAVIKKQRITKYKKHKVPVIFSKTPRIPQCVQLLTTTVQEKKVIYLYVPVRVKTTHNSKDVIVNCAIDNCSSDSWISDFFLKKLNLRTPTTRLNLTKMKGKHEKTKILVINNLQIFDIDGNKVITLPGVYIKSEASWSFSREDLITQSNLDQFNPLKNIPFKLINANIDLFVGNAVPAFTKTLQVIDGTPNEPYAARHMYGWAFNGPILIISSKSICNRMTVQESNDLDDNLNRFYSKNFVDYSYERTLSYDDKKNSSEG